MLAIQTQYESILDAARKTPQDPAYAAKYGLKNEKLDETLDEILATNLSLEDVRRLAATCGTLPTDQSHWNGFTREVFSYMMQSIVDSGDRDLALRTLSTRCPDFIGPFDLVEFYLVEHGDKVKEPVSLLGEAYSNCRDPDVRRHIAAAVRRGFTSLGVRGTDDAEFVANAVRWYNKEKGRLVLNPRHRLLGRIMPHNEDDPNFRWLVQYDKMQPLFVRQGIPGTHN
jgi:hypothetical protein